jgi:TolB-like protein
MNALLKGGHRLKIAVALSSCFLLSILTHAQDTKDLSSKLADAIAKSGQKTVAVVDFTDLQGCVTEFGRFLAEQLSLELATSSNQFDVIDRTNLKTLLQEHKLASTGIIDPQTARKVGEIAGVQALVTATITPFGDNIRLAVKVLDAQTAKIVGGMATDFQRNKAVDDLLKKGISGGCGVATEESTVSTSRGQDSQMQLQPKTSVSGEIGDFVFSIQRCRNMQGKIECVGTVTNQGSKRAEVVVDDRRTNIVDNLGNQSRSGIIYNMSHSIVRVGTTQTWGPGGTVSQELEPSLPLVFGVSGVGLDENAKFVSIILVTRDGQTTLRSIALQTR